MDLIIRFDYDSIDINIAVFFFLGLTYPASFSKYSNMIRVYKQPLKEKSVSL